MDDEIFINGERYIKAPAAPKRKPAGVKGPILPGQRFVWEPYLPHAYEILTVTRIQERQDGETRIYSRGERFRPNEELWNDESRFREACERLAENG